MPIKPLPAWLAFTGLLGTLAAQTPPTKLQFEVASVKPTAEGSGPGGRFPQMRALMRSMMSPGAIPTPDPGRVRIENWPLLDLIAAAYSVRAAQVSGPSWLSEQGFDIEAKVPAGTPTEQLNQMLETLLEERFGLQAHRESRTQAGFALVVGKNGPRLNPAEPVPEFPKDLSPEERQDRMKEQMAQASKRLDEAMRNGAMRPVGNSAHWPAVTTAELASALVRFVQAPVADMTGLTGKYSVTVRTYPDTPDEPGQTIFDAVEKLGLKLEARKITVDQVVVDQVNKMPTAN